MLYVCVFFFRVVLLWQIKMNILIRSKTLYHMNEFGLPATSTIASSQQVLAQRSTVK